MGDVLPYLPVVTTFHDLQGFMKFTVKTNKPAFHQMKGLCSNHQYLVISFWGSVLP